MTKSEISTFCEIFGSYKKMIERERDHRRKTGKDFAAAVLSDIEASAGAVIDRIKETGTPDLKPHADRETVNEILKLIEGARANNERNNPDTYFYTDGEYKTIAAAVAALAGYKTRAEWINEI